MRLAPTYTTPSYTRWRASQTTQLRTSTRKHGRQIIMPMEANNISDTTSTDAIRMQSGETLWRLAAVMFETVWFHRYPSAPAAVWRLNRTRRLHRMAIAVADSGGRVSNYRIASAFFGLRQPFDLEIGQAPVSMRAYMFRTLEGRCECCSVRVMVRSCAGLCALGRMMSASES